jgi:oxygen-independent coproporphyrinogen-3 oxidase
MSPLGLYVHIPFCGSICSYCNFNRGLFDAALKDRYVRALGDDIRRVAAEVNAGRHPATGRPLSHASPDVRTSGRPRSECPAPAADDLRTIGPSAPRPFGPWDLRPLGPSDLRTSVHRPAADTIYFGGGTPSLLSPDEIGRLIEVCRSAFDVAGDAEVTLEANPETVSVDGMAAYRAAGVNRVSMGVQSFRDEELRRLGRVHDAARARAAFEAVRAAGIDNVSLDLMLWLPRQTVDDCLFSVRALASLGPSHASLYLLELYPNAPLKEEMARSGWSLAPDEDAADMYLRAIDLLAGAGYEHYEISNVSRPGLASRHNLKYWTDQEWLAFGCGAHSTTDGVRWKNVSATDAYVAALERGGAPAIAELRELNALERFQEAVFMGLRLVAGIDLQQIERRHGIDLWRRYGDRLAPLVEAGLLDRGAEDAGRLRLTPRGLLLSNEVMSVFVDETAQVR